MTAAHVIVNPSTGVPYTNLTIRPHHNIPAPTPEIAVADAQIDNAFVASPTASDRLAHDIGFIRIAPDAPLPQYPSRYLIGPSSLVWNTEAAFDSCQGLGGFYDPLALPFASSNQAITWFGAYTCNGALTTEYTMGYPTIVNGIPQQPNAIFPYVDQSSLITYWRPTNYPIYELYVPSSSSLPTLALITEVQTGESGGAVYGINSINQSFWNYVLLGIISSKVTSNSGIGAIAGGYFSYNEAFVDGNSTWNPAQLVSISSPGNGDNYTVSSTINLAGAAARIANQLVWSSSIDGSLGSGSAITLQPGRLSPGIHTITASIPGSTLATKSVQITLSSQAMSISVNPEVVQIGAFATSGPFSITYNAHGYPSVDWYRQTNGGSLIFMFSTSGTGTFDGSITRNTTYTYSVYPHGNMAVSIGGATVRTAAAIPPSFVIPSSYSVVTTGTGTANALVTATASPQTAPYTMRWNAPGYQFIDLWGSVDNGAWNPPFEQNPIGSATDAITIGTVRHFRMYPHGDNAHILGSFDLRAIPAPAPSFVPTPSVVIVPPNATSGSYSFTYNAPGYEYIDARGSTNGGPFGAAWVFPTSGVSPSVSLAVGSTVVYKFYPHNDTTHVIGGFTVTARH